MRKRTLRWLALILVISFVSINAQAFALDSQAVTLRQMYDKMDNLGGNWMSTTNNDSSALAWHESYVLDSYINMYRLTKDTRYLDKFVTQGKNVLNQRDSVRGVKDYRGLSLPGWSSVRYNLNDKRYVWAVHTGMIVTPMAKFATLVNNNPALANYKTNADIFLKAAKDAVAIHNDEWVENGYNGTNSLKGYYIIRKGAPFTYDGVGLPHNQMLAIARAELAIYEATGDKLYLNRVTKIAQLFKNNLKVDTATNSYLWYYDWGYMFNGWTTADKVSINTPSYGGHKPYEDTSHGAIDILAVYDLYKAGVVFNQNDMVKFGNTIQKKIVRTNGTIANRVDGSGTYADTPVIGLYLQFSKYAPSLYSFANKILAPAAKSARTLLGISLLNWAHYEDVNGDMPYIGYKPPVVPASVTATVSPNSSGNLVQISWATSTNTNISFYRIYRSQTQGQQGTLVADNVKTNSFIDTVTEGQTYFYSVTAVDTAGNQSAASSQVSIIPKIAPDAPTDLKAVTVNSNSQVQLTWAASGSTDTGFYRVYRSQAQAQQGSLISDNINSTTWTDINVTPGQLYYYTVTTVDKVGNESSGSNQISISIPAPAPAPVPDPVPVPDPGTILKPFEPALNSEQIINSSFSDTTGWTGLTGRIKTEPNGNSYLSNSFNWQVYQEITVTPNAKYIIDAKTKKGTSTGKTRLIYHFIDNQGNLLPYSYENNIFYTHIGTGWENIPRTLISTPEKAVKLRLYLTTSGSTGNHDFDNISIQKLNLLQNGSFSNNDGWNGLTGKINVEPNGNKYLTNGYNWLVYQDVSVTPNTNYYINAKVRKNTSQALARLNVFFLDAQGNKLSNINVYYQPTTTVWETIPTRLITPPANTATIRVYVTPNGGTGVYDYDDISLTK